MTNSASIVSICMMMPLSKSEAAGLGV